MKTITTILAVLATVALPSTAWAQWAAGYDPVGVKVDAQGVLRSRSTETDPRLIELWKKARERKNDQKLAYVSLPRLFAAARAAVDANAAMPDDVRFMGGMTKLQYVFVYPDSKDIVVAGPAEPYDASVAYRPLGLITGRPVLHLADFVTALRAFSQERKPDRIGCDIEITREIQERVRNAMKSLGPAAREAGVQATADKIAEAGGGQPIVYYGIDPETRFGVVCVEADYILKQLALGLYKSPAPKVLSYKSMISGPEPAYRFSLESNYEALAASPDGLAFELKGHALKVNGGIMGRPDSTLKDVSFAARRFVELCNENVDSLFKHIGPWADLANLSDLSVIAALIMNDKLAEKVGWDTAWLVDPKGYPVPRLQAPKTAQTLCSYKMTGGQLVWVAGGVWLKPHEDATRRSEDTAVSTQAKRPDGENWVETQSGAKK